LGLKGTDNHKIIELAQAEKVSPRAQERAFKFIEGITKLGRKDFCFYTSNSKMGEDYLLNKGITFEVIYEYKGKLSTSKDTEMFCEKLVNDKVEAIFFVGGDGTACDIFRIIENRTPIIGIPAGVKMYSGIFCTTINTSVKIFSNFLGDSYELSEEEIIDMNEEDYRKDRFNLKVYGYALTLRESESIQGSKSDYYNQDEDNQEGIAKYFIENMERDAYYILGPGTTVKAIPKMFNQPYTLLGVDILLDNQVIALDVNEKDILNIIDGKKAKLILSPLGGQGIILGRGNQQISSKVLRTIKKSDLILLSTEKKINELRRNYLIADVDDDFVKKTLSGYVRVLIDYNVEKVLRLIC
jgi:predicted polyphosphate/ATP-dependent NAD kinase